MLLIVFILFCNIFIITNVKAQPPTIVKGYVYINETITEPEGVSLFFPEEIKFASVYDDGRYVIIFESIESGITGTFVVYYKNVEYTAPETLTIKENEYLYDIDLNIETSGGELPDDLNNIQPKADANGPYYVIVNYIVNFDGSASYDSDGTITNYKWDFGDGEISKEVSPKHIYSTVDNYRVILTVTDNEGKTDIDITYAYIMETQNYPPTKPVIDGPLKGSANTLYNYTLFSTDIENNTIQYVFDWGDDTDITSSHFLENGTLYTANHSWKFPGIYILNAYTIDENNIVSEVKELNVLINSIYLKNIGYMTDFTNDGYYDLFNSNITGEETPVDIVDNLYLIDENNDGSYDYEYNIIIDTLNEYSTVEPENEKSTNFYETIEPFIPYFAIGIVLIIVFLFLEIKKLKKTKKKKVKKEKKIEKKEENKKEKSKERQKQGQREEDIDIKKIEDNIDKL